MAFTESELGGEGSGGGVVDTISSRFHIGEAAMNAEQITLVQKSYEKVRPIAATAAELFYAAPPQALRFS